MSDWDVYYATPQFGWLVCRVIIASTRDQALDRWNRTRHPNWMTMSVGPHVIDNSTGLISRRICWPNPGRDCVAGDCKDCETARHITFDSIQDYAYRHDMGTAFHLWNERTW